MNSKVCTLLFWLALIGVLQYVQGSVEILQGPSSKTIVKGPDGSAISSLAPGGIIVIDGQSPLVVAAGVVPSLPVGLENVVIGPAASISTTYTLAEGPAVVASVDEVTTATTEVNTEEDDGSYKGDE